jgi:hypothetical protein
MARQYSPTRNLDSLERARVRSAALIARRPVTATVSRLVGDGLTAPKTRQDVATFSCRLDVVRRLFSARDAPKDAYISAATVTQLTALRVNDAADYSGRPVDIKREDRVTVTDEDGVTTEYTADVVQLFRSHLQVDLNARG